MYITLPLRCPVPYISLYLAAYTHTHIYIPNHFYIPVMVIPKAQMIHVFLCHADNDTGEKISKLYIVPKSVQKDNQISASKNQIFKTQMTVAL